MEVKLVSWIKRIMAKGLKITQVDIRKKAREIVEKEGNGLKFTASKGWLEKFFNRNRTVYRKIIEVNRASIDDIVLSEKESESNRPNTPR